VHYCSIIDSPKYKKAREKLTKVLINFLVYLERFEIIEESYDGETIGYRFNRRKIEQQSFKKVITKLAGCRQIENEGYMFMESRHDRETGETHIYLWKDTNRELSGKRLFRLGSGSWVYATVNEIMSLYNALVELRIELYEMGMFR
jgi:hypothetical protein